MSIVWYIDRAKQNVFLVHMCNVQIQIILYISTVWLEPCFSIVSTDL